MTVGKSGFVIPRAWKNNYSSLGLRDCDDGLFSIEDHSATSKEMGSSNMNKFGNWGFRIPVSSA